jgi:hypothetical protein
MASRISWLIAKFIGATEDADGNTTAWKHFSIYCQVLAIVTAMITNVGWQKLVAYGPLEVPTLTFICRGR